jgi:predicted GTPase
MTIIVFGSSGQGKTSLINLLCNTELPVTNAAAGCTFQSHEVRHENLRFIDTCGLDEAGTGTVAPADALLSLVELLKACVNGVALLVFVKRQGRIYTHDKSNFDLFVGEMTKGRIPAICVVTGCEDDDDMQRWPRENRVHFERAGMHFINILGCCAKTSKSQAMESILATKRAESRAVLMQAIVDISSENAPFRDRELVRRMWNFFCSCFGTTLSSWLVASETLIDLFYRLTGDSEKARRLALAVEGLQNGAVSAAADPAAAP